uniref:Uncharacterized protein n=1 Tax=Triticum urartu TaxID=4572 RepID=A0A8R7V1T8_TRIUA
MFGQKLQFRRDDGDYGRRAKPDGDSDRGPLLLITANQIRVGHYINLCWTRTRPAFNFPSKSRQEERRLRRITRGRPERTGGGTAGVPSSRTPTSAARPWHPPSPPPRL